MRRSASAPFCVKTLALGTGPAEYALSGSVRTLGRGRGAHLSTQQLLVRSPACYGSAHGRLCVRGRGQGCLAGVVLHGGGTPSNAFHASLPSTLYQSYLRRPKPGNPRRHVPSARAGCTPTRNPSNAAAALCSGGDVGAARCMGMRKRMWSAGAPDVDDGAGAMGECGDGREVARVTALLVVPLRRANARRHLRHRTRDPWAVSDATGRRLQRALPLRAGQRAPLLRGRAQSRVGAASESRQ